MNEFFSFLIKHYYLSSALLVIMLLIIVYEIRERVSKIDRVSPDRATDLINHDNAAVVDIRAQELFTQGHIIGSKHIEAKDLKDKLVALKIATDRPIVLVCNTGQTAYGSAVALHALGYTKVCVLAGGVSAWKEAGLPLTTKES